MMCDKVMAVAMVLFLVGCEGTLGVPDGEFDPETGEPLGSTFPGAREGAESGSTSGGTTPGAASTGEELYNQYCATCHGPEGSGTDVWSGSIAGYEPIAGIVTDGRGAMAPVPIDDDQTAAIQTYLLSLGGVDISTLNGLEVYELRCASCHGDEGQGTERAFQLRYRADEYSKYVVRHGRTSSLFESDMPAYDDISEEQLDEMFDWLGSFPNPDSGDALYARYCANCHGDDGQGGPTGKDIASDGDSTEKIRGGENLNNPGDRREYMPRWNNEALTDQEVGIIEDYVASLPD